MHPFDFEISLNFEIKRSEDLNTITWRLMLNHFGKKRHRRLKFRHFLSWQLPTNIATWNVLDKILYCTIPMREKEEWSTFRLWYVVTGPFRQQNNIILHVQLYGVITGLHQFWPLYKILKKLTFFRQIGKQVQDGEILLKNHSQLQCQWL